MGLGHQLAISSASLPTLPHSHWQFPNAKNGQLHARKQKWEGIGRQ